MDYILTFLEGIASFISPCLLPMVPIYISYFIGEDNNNNKKAKWFAFFIIPPSGRQNTVYPLNPQASFGLTP